MSRDKVLKFNINKAGLSNCVLLSLLLILPLGCMVIGCSSWLWNMMMMMLMKMMMMVMVMVMVMMMMVGDHLVVPGATGETGHLLETLLPHHLDQVN